MSTVLSINHLTRTYGSVVANDDISLTVAPGEVVGLLGHNGAGKTTLVNQIVGILKPDAGSIRLGSLDAVADPAGARRLVAIQPQSTAPIDGLTPPQAIELAARIRGRSSRDAKAIARDLVDELDLGEWASRRAAPENRGLSGGVRRLVAFAMALATPTPLLILDEPTNDVDAARRRLLWDAVRRRGDEGAGVLVVTHNVHEAEHVVDDLVILHHGRVLAHGTPAALRGASDDALRLHLQLTPSATGLPPADQFPVRWARSGRRGVATLAPSAAATAVDWANALRADGLLEAYTLGPATLEDTYLHLTADAGNSTAKELHHV